MINLATPGFEGALLSVKSQFAGREGPRLDQWLVGNPAVQNKYEFVGLPIDQLPATNARQRLGIKSLSEPCTSTPLSKVVLDGFLVLAILLIIFGVSAWLYRDFILHISSIGDHQILNFLQRDL